jgi:undecaprenyl diphosphate synthase
MTKQRLPAHIGIIMDGNRRWQQRRGRMALSGHKRGLEVLVKIVAAAQKRGIQYLSVYAFSTENWGRDKGEVDYLMDLTVKAFDKYLAKMHRNGVRIIMMGSYEGLAASIAKAFKNAEKLTRDNWGITLCIAFNYGGQAEIVAACRKILAAGISAKALTTDKFADYLYVPFIPAVDLLIRTAGEQRLSNFMLWRVAYSEFYFTDKLWPDFNDHDLAEAIDEYVKRQRRFGT